LPLAGYRIARKLHCTRKLFSMFTATAHVPTAFFMLSSNVLAVLQYIRHWRLTQGILRTESWRYHTAILSIHHVVRFLGYELPRSRSTPFLVEWTASLPKDTARSSGYQTTSTAATCPIAAITALLTTRRVGLFVVDAGNITP
jgi:hypothetical protein